MMLWRNRLKDKVLKSAITLFARMQIMPRDASFALYFTTPDETALAPFHMLHDLRIVATSTAEKLTPFSSSGCLVALTTSCAKYSVAFIPDAEVGGIFCVN